MRHTGGCAVGETSTRSRLFSRAFLSASKGGRIPICWPSSPITRISRARMRSFVRIKRLSIPASVQYLQRLGIITWAWVYGRRLLLIRLLLAVLVHFGIHALFLLADSATHLQHAARFLVAAGAREVAFGIVPRKDVWVALMTNVSKGRATGRFKERFSRPAAGSRLLAFPPAPTRC